MHLKIIYKSPLKQKTFVSNIALRTIKTFQRERFGLESGNANFPFMQSRVSNVFHERLPAH